MFGVIRIFLDFDQRRFVVDVVVVVDSDAGDGTVVVVAITSNDADVVVVDVTGGVIP